MDGNKMSKWKFWKKVQETPTVNSSVKYCCNCGGKVMRQTKLNEFFDMTPTNQKRLYDFEKENREVTESIGFNNKRRKYRGNI
tara:strand:- start:845 stop:1093 length:249 start_codon:yes stop_codon:yes gene_type:complete